jgi:hypothetical protein
MLIVAGTTLHVKFFFESPQGTLKPVYSGPLHLVVVPQPYSSSKHSAPGLAVHGQ